MRTDASHAPGQGALHDARLTPSHTCSSDESEHAGMQATHRTHATYNHAYTSYVSMDSMTKAF
eukprot:scaffold58899_cov24-Tisochrysis_lutea.AAC.3